MQNIDWLIEEELPNKIILEKEDAEAFLNSVQNPPKPNKKLIDAFKEYGLIGCLNDAGITSTNYKQHLWD